MSSFILFCNTILPLIKWSCIFFLTTQGLISGISLCIATCFALASVLTVVLLCYCRFLFLFSALITSVLISRGPAIWIHGKREKRSRVLTLHLSQFMFIVLNRSINIYIYFCKWYSGTKWGLDMGPEVGQLEKRNNFQKCNSLKRPRSCTSSPRVHSMRKVWIGYNKYNVGVPKLI